MANWKKFAMGAAGAAGGEALNVEDVFSTYLYYPTGNTHTVTNGIDLSGEGGLVWLKNRLTVSNHELADTERGVTKKLSSNSTAAEDSLGDLSAFNSDGFSLTANNGNAVYNTAEVASWTFRKAPKFFDVVTYTGNGSTQTISHNLGSVPGCIIVKRTDSTSNWAVYHRGNTAQPETEILYLNLTNATSDVVTWNDTAPTSTDFQVFGFAANSSGGTYVAYLFAHNDGDGDFGPTGDQDIIKCGSYTGSGSAGNAINLGFEPQWVLIKNASRSESWHIWDTMRGIVTDGTDPRLFANTSAAEANNADVLDLNPTGFTIEQGNSFPYNYSGDNYIYIAIRRGPMAVPESATDVFDVNEATNPRGFVTTGFPVDLHMQRKTEAGDGFNLADRLRGENKFLYTTETSSEYTFGSTFPAEFDHMNGIDNYSYSSQAGKDTIFYNWKRAPNYFDVVAYTGTGSATTINHNLGVAPEMMWVKKRSSTGNWIVYHSGIDVNSDGAPETDYILLDSTAAAGDSAGFWNDTAPTASNFSLGSSSAVNQSGQAHVAFLFASLAGVSKVGSYTGNGTSQTIDCGFTSGARFVLIKRTDSTGDWYIWDTERGIVAANDPHLSLNTTAAEVTTDDSIDPVSSGFAVNQVSATNINVSSASYIFYAVS